MTLPVVMMNGSRPMVPRVSTFTAEFWSALSDGRFVVTRCDACQHKTFPPKRYCPRCRQSKLSWRELTGRGRLYSLTRVHAGPARFSNDLPYVVGIVDLDEGVRLVTRVIGPVDFVNIDQPVQLVVLMYDDGAMFAARLPDDGDV